MKIQYTILAAAFASAAFASAASATEGEYYPGLGGQVRMQGIDLFTTQGIHPVLPQAMTDTRTINNGDYYKGVDRTR